MSNSSNLITPDELRQNLDDASWRVVDCRFNLSDVQAGRRQYRDGHIPGAVFADLDQDLAAPIGPETGRHPLPDAEGFAATLARLGIDNSSHVVVYDDSTGALASRAWWMLRWLGHSSVRLLDGGMDNWLRLGYELHDGEERAQPRQFVAHPGHDRVITSSELAGNFSAIGALRLVDARDAARFRGEIEPIDSVAGHIPGAISLPLTESLNDDGTWKHKQELKALWSRVLGSDTARPWAVMCGSGVTACHLAISGVEAGYCEPRLYVGSWSEWIRDPRRPVAIETG